MEQNLKWCIYNSFNYNIGKVVKIYKDSVKFLYAENQIYPVEYWNLNYIKIFKTIEEAIIHLVKKSYSVSEIKEKLSFPSYTKNIDWKKMKKLEISQYRNLRYFLNETINENNNL